MTQDMRSSLRQARSILNSAPSLARSTSASPKILFRSEMADKQAADFSYRGIDSSSNAASIATKLTHSEPQQPQQQVADTGNATESMTETRKRKRALRKTMGANLEALEHEEVREQCAQLVPTGLPILLSCPCPILI